MPKITRQRGGNGQAASPGRPAPGRQGGLFDRITPVSFEDEGIQVLLYGRSGTGKTTLWGTFPKPILAAVCSAGRRPGELRSVMTPENKGKIFQVVLERSAELKELAEYAETHPRGFRTVVLDHLGGLESLVLKEILGLEELPPQKTWGLASREQYGQCTLQCKELLLSFLNLRLNVVLVAHERVFKGDDDSDVIQPHVSTALTPSLTGWVVGAMDYVGHTFLRQKFEIQIRKIAGIEKERRVPAGGVEFCLRTGPDATYATKFRVPGGGVPDVIVDPTYEKILAVINGGVEVEKGG